MKQTLILTFILTIFSPHLSYSQSRTNRSVAKLIWQSDKLEKAIGWEYNNSTGEWVDNRNVIAPKKARNGYSKSWYEEDNFIWLKTFCFYYEDDYYFALIQKYHDGQYKYPNLKMDYFFYQRYRWYLLDSAQFLEIQNVVDAQEKETIQISCLKNGFLSESELRNGVYFEGIDEAFLIKMSEVISGLNEYSSSFMTDFIHINSQNLDGSDIVRFKMEGCYPSGSECLDEQYFELEREDFKVLFKAK